MKDTNIPLFDLVTTPSLIIVAGGGGNKAFGKENGIVFIHKNDINSTKPAEFIYKTEDFIRKVKVYMEDEPCEDYEIDDISMEQESDSSDLESIPEIGSQIEEDDKQNTEDSKIELNVNEKFYIAAAGETYFYLLKYDGKLELIKRIKYHVDDFSLTKHLFILYGKRVYGFYDIFSKPSMLKLRSKIIEEEDSFEEYFYKLYKERNMIVYKREDGQLKIPNNWDGFFIIDKKIHKIVNNDGKYNFVYRNKKYEFQGKLSRIFLIQDTLIFFSNAEKGSLLYFIKDEEKVFELPKLTCIFANNDLVVVSSCKGELIAYKNNEFYNKKHVSDLPITGISIDNGSIYYSILNGIVDKTIIRESKGSYGFLLALLTLILAAIIAYHKHKK